MSNNIHEKPYYNTDFSAWHKAIDALAKKANETGERQYLDGFGWLVPNKPKDESWKAWGCFTAVVCIVVVVVRIITL